MVSPFFLKKPLDKITANESATLSLLCSVGGTPEPEVEWFKHGASIPFERASVSSGSRLTITAVVPEDSGRYQCSFVNSAGLLHHVFEVTIQRKNLILIDHKFITALCINHVLTFASFLFSFSTFYLAWKDYSINTAEKSTLNSVKFLIVRPRQLNKVIYV